MATATARRDDGAVGTMLGAEAAYGTAERLGDGAEGEAERALVAAAKRDRAAFAVLYARYLDRVYWFCYRQLGTRELAEDAASLTFTKALAGLASCRDDRFRPWLFRIARNVVADTLRAAQFERSLAAAIEPSHGMPTPEEIAVAHDDQARVGDLLDRLSSGQRQVVELRLAGLTGAEIARALGRSHVSVRITQMRAYTRLRQILADQTGLNEVPGRDRNGST